MFEWMKEWKDVGMQFFAFFRFEIAMIKDMRQVMHENNELDLLKTKQLGINCSHIPMSIGQNINWSMLEIKDDNNKHQNY